MTDLEERFPMPCTVPPAPGASGRPTIEVPGHESSQLDHHRHRRESPLPLSQSELAERLGVEGATMVAMMDRLVKAGLVARRSFEDRPAHQARRADRRGQSDVRGGQG